MSKLSRMTWSRSGTLATPAAGSPVPPGRTAAQSRQGGCSMALLRLQPLDCPADPRSVRRV
jgi:hypothetical protein